MNTAKRFINLPFTYHLVIGAVVRLALVVYGDYHDSHYDVPYTDVDYKVFTDASRHVLNGNSPYNRDTYRYSPIIAYLMLPNFIIGRHFGKILFSIFDVLLTVAVKVLVGHQVGLSKCSEKISVISSLFWLYNPLSIGISTRGNADSVPCFLIILSIFFLQTNTVKGVLKFVLSGFFLGIAIHLRIYPLVFSFPMYLSLGEYKITRRTSMRDGIISLLPNKNQLVLTFTCIFTLSSLTYGMYVLYGYEFLFETYIYHLFRKDTKHNFSVLFYYSYLTMDQLVFDIVKTMTQVSELIILFVLSLAFGTDPKSLCFALFSQAVVLVTFNSVVTSQYFIWFLSLMPLVVHNFKIRPANAVFYALLWVISQAAWLFYAYALEFKSREVFLMIWLASIVFFCANIFILSRLIKSFTPNYGFGLIKSSHTK